MTAAVGAFDDELFAAATAVPIPQSRPGRILGLARTVFRPLGQAGPAFRPDLLKFVLQLVGVLMASGDAISQFVVEKKSLLQYDRYRATRFFLFGTFILVCIVFVTYAKEVMCLSFCLSVCEQY